MGNAEVAYQNACSVTIQKLDIHRGLNNMLSIGDRSYFMIRGPLNEVTMVLP